MKTTHFAVVALTVGACLSSGAANFQWNGQGEGATWGGALNWLHMGQDAKPFTWTGQQVAIFEATNTVASRTVVVDKQYSPGQFTVRDNYQMTGDGSFLMNLATPASAIYVADGKTLTMDVPLQQTSDASAGRLYKGSSGTVDFQKDVSAYRFQNHGGTTKVTSGATMTITGTSTSPGAEGAVLSTSGGKVVVEGTGSKLVVANATSYLPNSGSQIVVRNGGTIDVSNVNEVLNGFSDNNGTTKSPYGSITIDDGGTFIAKQIRVGKCTSSFFNSNPDYARVNLLTNGVLKLSNFTMDNSGTQYAEVNFNGGALHMTGATANRPLNSGSYKTSPWAGLHYYIREGGLRLNNAVNATRNFDKPLESGAEKDGGLTVEGVGGVLYMDAANTFNGPTRLTGSGGVIYVPLNDAAFGAVPAEPTDNIIFEQRGVILHSDKSFEVHPNRTMRIKKDVQARIGNGGHLAFRGAVLGEAGQESSTSIWVEKNWSGSLTLIPDKGKVNMFGRLITQGHTVIGAGETQLVSPVTQQAGTGAVLYVGDDALSAFHAYRGILDVTNGLLKVTANAENSYLVVKDYGQLRVSGGTLDCAGHTELLHAMTKPARIEVSGTAENPGLLKAYIIRASQSTTMEGDLPAACISLRKGGTLELHHFNIDAKASQKGRVDFDGGILKARSTRDNMLGSGTGAWLNILFRVCKGGLIFDTNNKKMGIQAPLLTGVTEGKDGGLTKKGSNVLYIRNGDFTYTGPTRTDMGQLIFEGADGTAFDLPGDVEVSVKELSKLKDSERGGTYIQAKSIPATAKLRVADAQMMADGPDPRTTFGKKIAILKTKEPMTKVPQIVLVDEDGNEKPSDGRWSATLSADRKTLTFGPNWITMIIVR